MEDKEKLEELYSLKNCIESKEFQEYIMKPLFSELDKQKNAYDCKTLAELQRVGGKKDGLMFLIKLLKEIDRQIKNTKFELDAAEERKL